MLEGHHFEVDGLDKGPDHVVAGEGSLVVLGELVARRGALEHGHGREEDANEARGKDALVEGDARGDGGVGGAEVDVALEEFEPGCCGRAKDGWGWRVGC